jgi:uncharacterized 2Fe-2S/4Fe-4S cluster protein (DUF4445 family)
MMLGHFPDCDLDNVYAVGNSAGDGAVLCLLNRERRQRTRELARWIEYVETAIDPNFQARFVDALGLPHSIDEFPHLEGLIPERPEATEEDADDRRRERRRERLSRRERQAVEG